MLNLVNTEFDAHFATISKVKDALAQALANACEMAVSTIQNSGKIIFFGNGGSAADAQHLAAELTGRYKTERTPLPAIALTTDTSALTAIGNDYGYEFVFLRQAQALAKKGDLLVGISTSGNSENVLKVLEFGRSAGIATLGFSGKNGGKMNALCDLNLVVPSDDTARIQEMHILFGHTICQAIDNAASAQK